MTPLSLPELETGAFRRSLAAALGLPIEGEGPRTPARTATVVDSPRRRGDASASAEPTALDASLQAA